MSLPKKSIETHGHMCCTGRTWGTNRIMSTDHGWDLLGCVLRLASPLCRFALNYTWSEPHHCSPTSFCSKAFSSPNDLSSAQVIRHPQFEVHPKPQTFPSVPRARPLKVGPGPLGSAAGPLLQPLPPVLQHRCPRQVLKTHGRDVDPLVQRQSILGLAWQGTEVALFEEMGGVNPYFVWVGEVEQLNRTRRSGRLGKKRPRRSSSGSSSL